MKPTFFSNYYLLTRTFTFIQKRLQRRAISSFAGLIKPERILDVGCGSQPYRVLFPNSIYIGMDIVSESRPMVIGDARYIPIKNSTVDCVLCTEVIEHVFDYASVIDEIFRILRPGGWLILTAPMSWGLHYEPHDYWRFTPYSLRLILERAGFHILRMEKVGGLFSLIGSRLVEGIALGLWRRWKLLPPKIRHGLILLFSIPTNLVFAILGDMMDRFIPTDYIGNAALARKPE